MSEVYTHIVSSEEQGTRLDVLLAQLKITALVSRSAAVRLIESGRVLVNGSTAIKKQLVLAGDELYIEIPPRSGTPGQIVPNYDIELDIKYEDEHLIVLSKQAGLVCHPAKGHRDDTLANALVAHCGIQGLAQVQGADRPGIVHRLDQDTSGLMLAAKTDIAAARLQDEIRLRDIERRYLALLHGRVAPDTGMIDAPLGRDPHERTRIAVVDESQSSRSAITSFEVRERFDAGRFDNGYTLVECHLYTGRTHQIRVHMAYINHPVVGDPIYGRAARVKARNRDAALRAELGLTRQFLHSWKLSFVHPITGQRLSFEDELPLELQNVLDNLRARE